MRRGLPGRAVDRAAHVRVALLAVVMLLVAAAAVYWSGDKVRRLGGGFLATVVASVIAGLLVALAVMAYVHGDRWRRSPRTRRLGPGPYVLGFWVLVALEVLIPGLAGVAVVGFCVGLWLYLDLIMVAALGRRRRASHSLATWSWTEKTPSS